MTDPKLPIVVSGMRPTGRLHLGHLHGAIANWVRLQETTRAHFFSADWHALTTSYHETDKLKQAEGFWRDDAHLVEGVASKHYETDAIPPGGLVGVRNKHLQMTVEEK